MSENVFIYEVHLAQSQCGRQIWISLMFLCILVTKLQQCGKRVDGVSWNMLRCCNIEQAMLSHRPLIDHHRKRFTGDGIVSSLVALQHLFCGTCIVACVLHLIMSEEDLVEDRSPGSTRRKGQ